MIQIEVNAGIIWDIWNTEGQIFQSAVHGEHMILEAEIQDFPLFKFGPAISSGIDACNVVLS